MQSRWADLKFEIDVITTRGDNEKTAITDIRAGRKGLFTGAIERALVRKKIDLAVHSAKDLPSTLAPNPTEARPDRMRTHSPSISFRRAIAATILRTPVVIDQIAM